MVKTKKASALISIGLLCGCAHVPDVTVGYYLPESSVSFKVVRTIACDAGDHPIIATAVTPTVKYSADTTDRHTVEFPKLKGAFADSDLKFEFYEDGRLSAVNASSTGQGETIFKTAISVITAAIGFDSGSKSYPDKCSDIKVFGGGKPLTLTYEGEIDLSKTPTISQKSNADGTVPAEPSLVPQQIKADTASTFYANKFHEILGDVYAIVIGTQQPKPPVDYARRNGDVLIHAREPGTAQIKLIVTLDEEQSIAALDEKKLMVALGKNETISKIWGDQLPDSKAGKDYDLPIPKPVLFGKETFAAAFTESGALKSVQYGKNTGVGQLLNVGSAGLMALQGDSVATQAANVKAQADLIAQQQRLVVCLAKPTECK